MALCLYWYEINIKVSDQYINLNFLIRLPLDLQATITINGQEYDLSRGDLEPKQFLGRGAHGMVEKMLHKPSNTNIAVKVNTGSKYRKLIMN